MAHSMANVRRTPMEMVEELGRMCQLRTEMGLHDVQVMAGMSVAFGCTRQGRCLWPTSVRSLTR